MSHRLQLLISEGLNARLEKAARRNRTSKGAWVRKAIEESLAGSGRERSPVDPVARLASLQAPTADIKDMLDEIEAGRS